MKTIFNGDKFKVTSGFELPERPDHHGIDLVGLDNITVISPIDGVVKSSCIITDKSNTTWEWGEYVRVDDEKGNRYYFCHLLRRLVMVGQTVKKGDALGIMGNTGLSKGAHTHFEIRKPDGKTRLNPAEFLGIANAIGSYTFNAEPDGWFKTTSGKWQYRKDGEFVKSQWVKDSGYWYFLGSDGIMVTGMRQIAGKLYYLNEQRQQNIPMGACLITDSSGAIKKV